MTRAGEECGWRFLNRVFALLTEIDDLDYMGGGGGGARLKRLHGYYTLIDRRE